MLVGQELVREKLSILQVKGKSGNFISSQGKLEYHTTYFIKLMAGRNISGQCDLSLLEVEVGGFNYI